MSTAVSLRAPTWKAVTLTDLSEVENLLDYLEDHGVAERRLVVLGERLFAVRWRAG